MKTNRYRRDLAEIERLSGILYRESDLIGSYQESQNILKEQYRRFRGLYSIGEIFNRTLREYSILPVRYWVVDREV